MDEQLVALYHRHVGMAFDTQLRLAEYLEQHAKGANWNYTVSTGTLEFGDAVRFQAHDLWSHASPDNSWMWAWNNPGLKLTSGSR